MSAAYSDAYFQRFSGIARLYGESALALFSRSHVCVIGIGGVGYGRQKRWQEAGLVKSR